MPRHRTTLLGFVAAVLVVAVAAVACVLFVLARPAGAAELPVLPRWQPGPREPQRAVWYGEGLAAAPAVAVLGGRGGLTNCEDDGSGVTFRCVVWAEDVAGNPWRQIVADEITVAERTIAALPLVGRSRSPATLVLAPSSSPAFSPLEPPVSPRPLALLALLLPPLFALLYVPPAAAAPTTRLILIDASGTATDDWTPERIAAAVGAVEEARAWWAARLGEPAPAPLAAPERLTVANPYIPALWMAPAVAGELAIYIVAERPGAELALVGGHSGLGWPGRLIALERPLHPGSLAALVTHELGHAARGLPDLDSDAIDIMARGYRIAYARGEVGCESLANLGRPCPVEESADTAGGGSYHVHLPLLATR